MKIEFEVPALTEFPEIPVIVNNAMAHCQPFVAKPEYQAPLGYPGELVED